LSRKCPNSRPRSRAARYERNKDHDYSPSPYPLPQGAREYGYPEAELRGIYLLNKINAIPKEFLAVILDMVRFRNRIVHIYWDIDPSQVYHLLREHLDDFDRFREYIVRFIEEEAI
jgi:hypothetical protein